MRKALVILLLALVLPAKAMAQPKNRIDVFAGAELYYRDIHWNKLMEVLVNITPGVKFHFGDSWRLSAQLIIPVYNDYGEFYRKVRLGMASVSHEFMWGKSHFNATAGFFNYERYGLDLKWLLPVTAWLAFDAQLGYTGYWCAQLGELSAPDRLTGWAGARIWLQKWNIEGRLRAGRFVYADYGTIAEGFRHFKHCSVGAYGQYSNLGGLGAGFKVIIMLPPYHQKVRKWNFRPASYFRFSHNIMADTFSLKMYDTDPEENEREGAFRKASWGPFALPR